MRCPQLILDYEAGFVGAGKSRAADPPAAPGQD